MKKLPLDLSTFSELRNSGYLYVDKTEYMYKMITGGRRFFLSRPRRFGKSLLVSTLKEILKAHKELFSDLWIGQSDYTWHQHGVITLDFSLLKARNIDSLQESLIYLLTTIADSYNIPITKKYSLAELLLSDIVRALSKQFGRVAILIDEYDSPILKTLQNESLAHEIRNEIQQFFTVIKGLDEYVQFVFITGVSSFAKAGLFSGINNLQILTLQKTYAAICGYTDTEIDHYFESYITSWAQEKHISYDDLRSKIKAWYNGYSFGHDVPKVYNPFSLMNALNTQEFKNFWFQSGAPTFLINIFKKEYKKFDSEKLFLSEDSLGIFDIGATPLITLMFQAGYLTISNYDNSSQLYTLDYPNAEVRTAFQQYLLEIFAHLDHHQAAQLSSLLWSAFNNHDIDEIISLLKQLFAHVPYQLHTSQEKFYHALVMMVCVGAGIKAQAEYSTSHGRIDLMVDMPQFLYIIEIKFNQQATVALQQIEERRYYERFIQSNKPTILLGLSFMRKPHDFDIEYAEKQL